MNIAEILKDCPKGMELDCVMFDNCTYEGIEDVGYINILIKTPCGQIELSKEGCFTHNCSSAKCIIFPKGKTTWEGFQRPFKDGDVVTWDDRGSLVACIYKGRKNTASFNYHIALYKGGLGIVVNGEIALTDDELCLATEEEKEKLFQAIKDNGYKWNPETKTLEKLIVPKFKVGDKIMRVATHETYIIDRITSRGYLFKNEAGIGLMFRDESLYELVPNKFDISTLKPFDKVLVRDTDGQVWTADLFSRVLNKPTNLRTIYVCVGHYTYQCIPYEGNEHLLDTTNDCDEYYKTWE